MTQEYKFSKTLLKKGRVKYKKNILCTLLQNTMYSVRKLLMRCSKAELLICIILLSTSCIVLTLSNAALRRQNMLLHTQIQNYTKSVNDLNGVIKYIY